MSITFRPTLLVILAAFVGGCAPTNSSQVAVNGSFTPPPAATKNAVPAGFTNEYSHTVQIGPAAYQAVNKAPNPNPVRIGLAPPPKYSDIGHVRFALTNDWNHRILVWWVRVQVHEQGSSFGEEWKTVAEDYPRGTKSAHISPGATDDVLVAPPQHGKPWRVSILYDREVANPPTYTGPVKSFMSSGRSR